ncbi:hypothetical protein, partial [Pseudomonas aeruginosa]|uniref:hypothetical protein n=1 Tax=Pseudomonas aeruginosa TaxID=287 RepID=UPI001969957F
VTSSVASVRPIRPPEQAVSYTHLRAHETELHLVCRRLLGKKKRFTAGDFRRISLQFIDKLFLY